jgi:hypothetical protein
LKLTGYISWSWWAVTSPAWGPFSAISVISGFWLLWHTVKDAMKGKR